jgi:serine/threonine protein kinase
MANVNEELLRLTKKPAVEQDPVKTAMVDALKYKIKHHPHRVSADLSVRIAYSKFIKKYIENIGNEIKTANGYQCITNASRKQKGVLKKGWVPGTAGEEFLVGKKLILSKRIGTDSANGVVYLTMGKSKLVALASKIMSLERMNVPEIEFLLMLSKMAESGVSPNLPICYKVINCTVPCKEPTGPSVAVQAVQENQKCPLFTTKPYFLLLNELANGDLKMWLKLQKRTDEEIMNAVQQTLLSLAVLHSLGVSHCDAHYGNFLYHVVEKGGFWWYKINGNDYYVENMGVLFMTWDFGFTTKHGGECTYDVVASPANDVIKLMASFIHAYHKFKTVSAQAVKVVDDFKNAAYRFSSLSTPQKSPIESMFRALNMHVPPPAKSKIVNKVPYTFNF